jgi:nucleoside-diphosphate-sugar epimerase
VKIFIAGATGAIGRRLVPLLVAQGHHVVASTRTPDKTGQLRTGGAEPVVLNGLDRDSVLRAVIESHPDVIVHQMTALGSMRTVKHFDRDFAVTNRLRTEGTEYLIAAARAAGTRNLVVQSYTGWPNIREGSRIKTENEPLDPNPPQTMSRTLAAIRTMESLITNLSDIAGTVLRYGSLYGPGTSISPQGEIVKMVRQRQFPVIGNGSGVWSFIHVDDAAAATKIAIENERPGIYNIVDDDPAEVSVWLPELARVIGAKPPRHIPAWLGRFAVGDSGVSMMTRIRGSSNAKARHILGWKPAYTSWRQGFLAVCGRN